LNYVFVIKVLRVEVLLLLVKKSLETSWPVLADELDKPYMQELAAFINGRESDGVLVFPLADDRFNAFTSTPIDKVKVVILGQDPYHGAGQAHGLSFSVQPYEKIPPSLVNIYKEIEVELGLQIPMHGCLSSWAEQGVLLLNTVLTVEESSAGSHQGKGWEQFTDVAIDAINQQCDKVVFMLWGAHAQKKAALIADKHLVLQAPHPSPLSSYRGFFGCGHFKQANEYMSANNKKPIDWSVVE
jgi:uracil-DNA glycosylase